MPSKSVSVLTAVIFGLKDISQLYIMKGLENSNNLLLYIISNFIALFMLSLSWKSVRLSRLLFFLIFAWASWTNWRTALFSPDTYLGEADLSFFEFYRNFILGWFSQHILLAVGSIATGQAFISLAMLGRGRLLRIGCWGGIAFLLAIAPLGVGSAFPCTIILAAAIYRITRMADLDYIWKKHGSLSILHR